MNMVLTLSMINDNDNDPLKATMALAVRTPTMPQLTRTGPTSQCLLGSSETKMSCELKGSGHYW